MNGCGSDWGFLVVLVLFGAKRNPQSECHVSDHTASRSAGPASGFAGVGKKTFMDTTTALLGEPIGWLSVLLLLLLLCAVLLITDHILLGVALF